MIVVSDFCEKNNIVADKELVFTALCHSSFTNEITQNSDLILESNERMEFLGDAVLDLSLATFLFEKYNLSEGKMSKIRAMVGSEYVLAKVALSMNLGNYLFLGKGENASGGAERDSILADALEAVLAAVYLSRGFEAARDFVEKRFIEHIVAAVNGELVLDYKTSLQELTQARFGIRPCYELVEVEGPPQNRVFCVNVMVKGRTLGCGRGKTKKSAEQKAARIAYSKLRDE